MKNYIDIQHATQKSIDITDEQLLKWANLALIDEKDNRPLSKPAAVDLGKKSTELTIRLVDTDEIMQLNHTYRKQNKPTNVLAFPANLPDNISLDAHLLGDIIICPDVVYEECKQLHKSIESHFALMVIHGVLHLLGYDHINDNDAEIMQAKEINLLKEIGFANPYLEEQNEI